MKFTNTIVVEDRFLFFDTNTKEKFLVSKSEFEDSKADYIHKKFTCENYKNPIIAPVPFMIKTATGEHLDWIYKSDEDYSEYMK